MSLFHILHNITGSFVRTTTRDVRGFVAALSIALACVVGATPVLAAGGADCQGLGGSCSTHDDCGNLAGSTDLGPSDCASLGQSYICCKAPAKAPPVSQDTSPKAPPLQEKPGFANFSLQLPACTQKGNCGLDDIVLTGVAVADLFMTLSGALFFGTFVYGGAMYLLSFGRSDWVSKGTKAMTSAVIGMTIVLSAWTIVNYIASSLTGKI